MYQYIVLIWLKKPSSRTISGMTGWLKAAVSALEGVRQARILPDMEAADSSCHVCAQLLLDENADFQALLALFKQDLLKQSAYPVDSIRTAYYSVADTPSGRAAPSVPHPSSLKMPKLLACIGPSNRDRETLSRLIDAGMNGVRLSLQHHTLEEVAPIADALRTASHALGVPQDILIDPFTDVDLHDSLRRTGATGIILSLPGNNETRLQALRAQLGVSVRLYAKVDCMDDLNALPSLLHHADELILARGGLHRNIPRHRMPGTQKHIAALSREAGKPFMIATGLLQTMRTHPFPAVAELNDIYHAIEDGAASLMLNHEVAVGRYPVEAMQMLKKTAETVLMG